MMDWAEQMAPGDLALIGFGEAGQAFARGWGAQAPGLRAFDIAFQADTPRAKALRTAAADLGVRPCASRAEALAGARAVFCLVTADRATAAATEAAPDLAPGALWLDGNSCAPTSKERSAEVIGAVGGRYVDVAIMAPVHPGLHRTPLLIAGPGSAAATALLEGLGMRARRLDDRVGSASSVKMLRSVMIKGLEALTAECVLAAARAGVADEVLASLQASNPGVDWAAQAGYNLERMMQHGTRRAAEMREVVATLQALGLPAAVSAAVADWHERIGAMDLGNRDGNWSERSEMVLSRL